MTKPTLLVIGAGPGVSRSVALTFARQGYDVALVGTDDDVLASLVRELDELGAASSTLALDITDLPGAAGRLSAFVATLGGVDVLHFNPSAYTEQGPLTLSVEQLLRDVALGVGALLTALQATHPHLRRSARVTVTGSMAADKPWHGAASLGVQKAGVRNLVQSIDAALSPEGVRAVSVTVRGMLATEGPFSPDRVAATIWDAAHQDESTWSTEVVHAPEA